MKRDAHLYIVEHIIDGERYVSACVGEDDLAAHVEMSQHFGAELKDVFDVESELKYFIWDVCFEGYAKDWLNATGH